MTASRRAVAVGLAVAAAALAAWLAWRPESIDVRPEEAGRRSDGDAADPHVAGAPGLTGHPPRPGEAVRFRVTSECGSAPVAGAVLGWGAASPTSGGPAIREVLTEPAGADGLVALDSSTLAAGGGEGESLLVLAAGHGTRALDDVLGLRPSATPVEVRLEKRTRIVGEMTWPPRWLGHVRGQTVSAGPAPASEGLPWTARSLALAEDGRSFQGQVQGCGRFWIVFSFRLDDEGASVRTTVEIDASTGPEVRVSMQPPADARQPSAEPLFRWTISVTDAGGSPVEGATVSAMRRLATHWKGLPDSWRTDRYGEAVREVAAGRYSFTVRKPGWGTAFAATTFDAEHRDVVRLVPARTRLLVRFTRPPSTSSEPVRFELRERAAPGGDWPWQPLETRGSAASSGVLEFTVAEGHEYAVFAQSGDLAPAAEAVARIGPEEHERTVDLPLETGDSVEVRGLEKESAAVPIMLKVEYDGLLGEILTATPTARFADGKWTIDHVARAAGEASAEVRGRRLSGRVPAAGEGPRILELR